MDTRIYYPRNIIFTKVRWPRYIYYSWFNKSWYPSNWKSLIVLLYDTFYMLLKKVTLKISFYHDVFFRFVWCKTLECYIQRALRRTRWVNVIFTVRYVAWGEYSVLSKNVSRDVRKDIWNHIIKCNKVCQWLAAGRLFSLCTPVSSNITNRHDITEILLKVALNTIPLSLNTIGYSIVVYAKNICEVYTMIRLNWTSLRPTYVLGIDRYSV